MPAARSAGRVHPPLTFRNGGSTPVVRASDKIAAEMTTIRLETLATEYVTGWTSERNVKAMMVWAQLQIDAIKSQKKISPACGRGGRGQKNTGTGHGASAPQLVSEKGADAEIPLTERRATAHEYS